jgi:hypothetical protein
VADDVMDKAAADAKPVPGNAIGTGVVAQPETRADRARRLVYRSRFAAFYVLLAIVAGAGVGALLVLVSRGSPAPAPAWSAWEPTGSIDSRAAQIAEHVSDPYRLPSGKPLVGVKSAPPTVTFNDGSSFAVRTIAVQPAGGSSVETSDIDTFDAARTVMYTMCGAGRGCSIPEGKPSLAREQLLRREALELALYSFRYLGGIDSALILFPPRAADKGATAVFLKRSEVRTELAQPLSDTLTAPLAPGVGEITSDEQRVIDRITRARLYEYDAWRTQDGSALIALAPDLSG